MCPADQASALKGSHESGFLDAKIEIALKDDEIDRHGVL
ncbi:MAG: hypothetical protein H6Q07_1984, partial [Acidobacteria bacterium]|nr:hypothetical protein [Acidobacteriota bacterium]